MIRYCITINNTGKLIFKQNKKNAKILLINPEK